MWCQCTHFDLTTSNEDFGEVTSTDRGPKLQGRGIRFECGTSSKKVFNNPFEERILPSTLSVSAKGLRSKRKSCKRTFQYFFVGKPTGLSSRVALNGAIEIIISFPNARDPATELVDQEAPDPRHDFEHRTLGLSRDSREKFPRF